MEKTKTIFDTYSKDEIEANIDEITELLKEKYKDEEIMNEIDCDMKEELLSIAKARLRASKDEYKDPGDEVLYYNEDDLRFSTPKIIADYRALRLKCNKIVDLCSGIGVQAGAFSKTCKEVLAIEIDSRKVKYAEENFKDRKNIKFLIGDVLDDDLINQVKEFKPDIIFCDPERLPEEKERTIESIKPGIRKLIDIYSKITPNLCIEVPPRIELVKLKELGNFEAEYLSLNNKLNRLNLYFGELKTTEVSCVDATTGVKIKDSNSNFEIEYSYNPMKYIYELSEAVVKANLGHEFAFEIRGFIIAGSEKGKLLVTSDELYFGEIIALANAYERVGVGGSIEEVYRTLKQKGFGKVVLKYSIDPKDYWRERNKLENGLFGKKEAVIFKVNKNYIIGKEV